MTKKKTKPTRRPYCKPQLEQVRLVAEEAVLAGCKTGGSSGPDVGACNSSGGPGKCIEDLT